MTTEAHKLIALSLNKIACSRRQRGGVNLRKNLMVAGVLFKARTIYIENYHTLEDTSTYRSESIETQSDSIEQQTDSNVVEEVCQSNESAGNLACEERVTSLDSPSIESETEQDKENTPPSINSSTVSGSTEYGYNTEKSTDEVADVKKDNVESDSPCTKCSKRRLTEVEAAVDSISPKRPRSDNVLTELGSNSVSRDSETQTTEPMQTEPTQISNLVNIFNSGFTGLLNSASESCKNQTLLAPVSTVSDSQQISCSTQIKEAFETLARPVLAMAL